MEAPSCCYMNRLKQPIVTGEATFVQAFKHMWGEPFRKPHSYFRPEVKFTYNSNKQVFRFFATYTQLFVHFLPTFHLFYDYSVILFHIFSGTLFFTLLLTQGLTKFCKTNNLYTFYVIYYVLCSFVPIRVVLQ